MGWKNCLAWHIFNLQFIIKEIKRNFSCACRGAIDQTAMYIHRYSLSLTIQLARGTNFASIF